jgi:3-oxoacyl-[acyl-carrier-protein] synthase-3
MAAVASHHALAAAGKAPTDLDLIILGTCTPDSVIPSAAALLQAKLEAWNAAAFDLNAACSGFIYSLVVAANMIRAGTHRTVMVIGAEKLHYHIDFNDRATCVLFGDGAGAVVLEAGEGPAGLLSSELGMDGSAAGILSIAKGGAVGNLIDFNPQGCAIRMDGPEVFRRAVTTMGDAAVRVVRAAGLSFDEVDLLVPHQANIRIIDAAARRLRLDSSKVYVNIGSYGNTSAATIPIALTEALEEGRVTPGANVVMAAFGAGLSWAAAVVRWGDRVTPIGVSDASLPPTELSVMELLEPNFRFFGGPERTR